MAERSHMTNQKHRLNTVEITVCSFPPPGDIPLPVSHQLVYGSSTNNPLTRWVRSGSCEASTTVQYYHISVEVGIEKSWTVSSTVKCKTLPYNTQPRGATIYWQRFKNSRRERERWFTVFCWLILSIRNSSVANIQSKAESTGNHCLNLIRERGKSM